MSHFSLSVPGLRVLLPAAAFLAMSAMNPALPQSKKSKAYKESQGDSEILLMERNRNLIHLGDPLRIVGIDQGGKEFRSETPALLQSDRAHVQVDQDDLRRRELAIYDRGELFSTPTAPVADAAPTQEDAPATPPVQGPAGGVRGVVWFTGIGSVVALIGLMAALGVAGPRRKSGSTHRPAEVGDGPIRVQARAQRVSEPRAQDVDSPTGIRPTRTSAASGSESSQARKAR